MTIQALNHPRKVLSPEDKLKRDILAGLVPSAVSDGDKGDVLVSNSGTTWRVESAANMLFVSDVADIQTALNSLTGGGIVHLAPGTYTLTSTLYLSVPGLTLRGSGDGVTILYMADRNTDIVVIEDEVCTIEDLSIFGTVGGHVNGAGAAGTGRGIVIAQPDSTHNHANPAFSTIPGNDTCSQPTIRRVTITNTGWWCIYDTGLKYPASGATWTNWTDPLSNSNKAISIFLTLECVNVAFWASGGGLFAGSGGSTPRISGFKTNGYSYGTYTQVSGSGSKPNNDLGSVFFYNSYGGVFDDLYLQSPSDGGILSDTDACMLSFLNCHSMTLHTPKFEVLAAATSCADSNGGAGGRQYPFITACNSSTIRLINPDFQSRLSDGASTLSNWGVKILRTSDQPSNVGITFEGGTAFHGRTTLGGDTGARVTGEPVTWDRNDFMFGGTEGATQNAQVIIEDFHVTNATTGKLREPTFPVDAFTVANCDTTGVSADVFTTTGDFSAVNRGDVVSGAGITVGSRVQYVTSTTTLTLDQTANLAAGTTLTFTPPSSSVVGRPHFHVRNRRGWRFGSWSSCDLTGAGNADDMFARSILSQNLRSGIMGYVSSSDLDEGLWITEAINAQPRQVPFYRRRNSHWSNPKDGDLNYRTDTQTFHWYDATAVAWKTAIKRDIGTAAGDLIYYTASDTPARLAVGATTGQALQVTGGAPAWGLVLAATTYTPGLTNVANLDASTAYQCQYMRVGNIVTVSGKVDVDPTAPAAATQLGIALPIASNLGAAEDCAGTAFASGIAGQGAAIRGDAANNRAEMVWVAGDVTSQPMYFTFTYEII